MIIFNIQLNYIKENLFSLVGKVRHLLLTNWELSSRAAVNIYKGLFAASALYGLPM